MMSGLGLRPQIAGLGLGLGGCGLGLESHGLGIGLGLGLDMCGLVNITGELYFITMVYVNRLSPGLSRTNSTEP